MADTGITLQDVFEAVIREFHSYASNYKNYWGTIPENFTRPSFLYLLTFSDSKRSSFFTLTTRLNLQVIVFTGLDARGMPDMGEQLSILQTLKPFLGQGHVAVKDRNLSFTYAINRADVEISIDFKFEFLEDAVTPEYDAQQLWDYMEHIYINKEELKTDGLT